MASTYRKVMEFDFPLNEKLTAEKLEMMARRADEAGMYFDAAIIVDTSPEGAPYRFTFKGPKQPITKKVIDD